RLKRRIGRIRDQVALRVYIAISSPLSVPVMQTAYALALENQRLKASVIEVEEFPRVAQALRISAVPFTIINERLRFAGALPPDALLDMIERGAEGRGLTAAE